MNFHFSQDFSQDENTCEASPIYQYYCEPNLIAERYRQGYIKRFPAKILSERNAGIYILLRKESISKVSLAKRRFNVSFYFKRNYSGNHFITLPTSVVHVYI